MVDSYEVKVRDRIDWDQNRGDKMGEVVMNEISITYESYSYWVYNSMATVIELDFNFLIVSSSDFN